MSLFDLVFIGCFLSTVIYGGSIVVLVIRRRWPAVRRHALRLGTGVGLYLLVVIAVGMFSPRRVLAPDAILRSDDWCLGVEKISFVDNLGSVTPTGPAVRFLLVTLKVSSTAGRVRQAAPQGSLVYVRDDRDARFDVSARGQEAFEAANGAQPSLTTKLEPNGSFLTTRVFEVPRDAKEFFLAHRHGSGFPGVVIIGQGFRAPPLIRLRS